MSNFLAEILILAIVGIGAAAVGTFIGLRYSAIIAYRQQKAVLVLLIQEFFLMIERCTMYYSQFLKGKVSFSTLFEISDSSTFVKLVELTDNIECIKHATEFKAGVFQAIRYANKASECMIQQVHHKIHGNLPEAAQAGHEAMNHQNMALNFFIGEQQRDGNFYRNLFVKYTVNLEYLLKYLEQLNSISAIKHIIYLITPRSMNQKKSIDAFIIKRKKILYLIPEFCTQIPQIEV